MSTLQKHEGDFIQLYKNERGGFRPGYGCGFCPDTPKKRLRTVYSLGWL